jgi:hypothetical protein
LEPILSVKQAWVPSSTSSYSINLAIVVQHVLNVSLIEARNASINYTFFSNTSFTENAYVGQTNVSLLTPPTNMTLTVPVVLASSTTPSHLICVNVTLTYAGPDVGIFPARRYSVPMDTICYSVPSVSTTTAFLGSLASILTFVGAALAVICKSSACSFTSLVSPSTHDCQFNFQCSCF